MKFTGERYIPSSEIDKELSIEHMQRYISIKNAVKGKKVLDAACGEGYGSFILSDKAEIVYGIDLSEETINHAKKKYKQDNIVFKKNSIENLPFEKDFFDAVVSFETIEHVSEKIQMKFIEEVKRVLKEEGIFIISTPDKRIYTDKYQIKNEFHIKEFYKDEFYKLLSKYFKYVYFYGQDFKVLSCIMPYDEKPMQIKSIETINDKHINNEDNKYIIAICSNNEIKDMDIQSVSFDNCGKYYKMLDRIVGLQLEVEEKNNWAIDLDEKIEKRDVLIKSLNERVDELSKWGQKLDKEIEKKNKVILFNNGKIEELNNTKSDLFDRLQEKEKIIIEDNVNIEKMKSEVKYIENKLYGLKESIEELTIEKKHLLENVEDQEKTIRDYEIAIGDYEKTIGDYEKTIGDYEKTIGDYKTGLKIINNDKNYEKASINDKQIELDIKNIKEIMGEYQNKIEKQDQAVANQKAHIEQLLEQERILNNIYKSGGWKLLLKYYKVRDFIVPPNSKRKLYIKLLKNPGQIIKHLNKDSIKKFKAHVSEDGGQLEERINKYIEQRQEPVKEEIKIYDEEEKLEKLIFNKDIKPLVSIIIPVYNQFNYTYSCLKSILENTNNISYEIIIGDDVSTDETINLKQYVENIKIIRNETNKRFLLNCNNASNYAEGKYILFLNNDTNVQNNWLNYLVELIEADKNIGMVGSKLVYPNGRLQEAGGILWNDASAWNFGRLDDPEKSEYNYVKEVDYISGASIMIRKDLWDEIEGFDKRYVPAYCEDSDLAFQVRRLGYKVMYQPKSVVVHFEGISNGVDTASGIKKYQIENNKKLYEKWKDVLQKNHFNNAENVFVARDRSKYKKTILVIDHYVPNYDKDAGSRTTFQYLKMFIESGFNVKFIGDNFYRQEPYTTTLQQMGVEVLYGPWYAQNYKKWIKDNGKYIDYIYLNRPHISIKYIDFIKENTDAKIIYYGHDLHYLREKREYELTGDKKLLTSSNKWKKIEFDIMRKADMTYYPSQVEIDEISKEDSSIKAKAIPAYIFETNIKKEINFENRKDLLFVGGFGHKPNVDAVLWFVNEILPKVQNKLNDIKFYIVGSNPPEQVKKLQSENIIVTGFVSDEELQNYYDKCKLVVVPLRYGAGVKGKVVEAMYQQVPIVTTSVGAEGINDAENVLIIADKEEEFAKNVIKYYSEIKELEKKSNKSLDYIKGHYTKESVIRTIKEDFNL